MKGWTQGFKTESLMNTWMRGRRRAYLFLEVSDLGGRLVPELIGNIHDNLHPLIHQPMKGGEGL